MPFDSGPKVYSFNPPTNSDRAPSHTGRIGLGTYYDKLGMRKSDVDRRTRALSMTGKDYLDVHAAYNRSKANKKQYKEAAE
jgi:hypothetical protein